MRAASTSARAASRSIERRVLYDRGRRGGWRRRRATRRAAGSRREREQEKEEAPDHAVWYDVVRRKVQLADADVPRNHRPGARVARGPRTTRAVRGGALEQRDEAEHRRAVRIVLALTALEHTEPDVLAWLPRHGGGARDLLRQDGAPPPTVGFRGGPPATGRFPVPPGETR